MFELNEALVIGPEDRLVLNLPVNLANEPGVLEALVDRLKELGLNDRTLLMSGNIEIAKVEAPPLVGYSIATPEEIERACLT